MNERPSMGVVHAYVDQGLNDDERRRFEARLSEDDELRRRVETFEAQREAIRAAFGAPRSPGATAEAGRPTKSTVVRVAMPRARPPSPAPVARLSRARSALRAFPFRPLASFVRRRGAVAAIAAIAWLAFPGGGQHDPRDSFLAAGIAAYRAYASAPTSILDVVSADPDELLNRLGPRFRAFPLAERLGPVWTLRGARLVPGLDGSAAFVVVDYERQGKIGLLIEPMDAPANSAPRAARRSGLAAAALTTGGFAMAIVGANEATVADLAQVNE